MAAELHTEGLQHLLELMNEQQSAPANYYVGLCTDTSLPENATLASLTELSGNGYGRQAVASDGTDLVSAGAGTNDRKLTTKEVRFTASGGNWVTAYTAFLCTVATGTAGKLIASMPLNSGAGRQLNDGQSLDVQMILQLNG